MKPAAIYARVSSDKQKEENTIASQTAALVAFATKQGYAVASEWVFEDEGYSGTSLIRPGLERMRDLAAEGHLDAVLVYAPDRLSRRYAYQVLLIEVFARAGAETLIIRSPRGGISGFPLSFRVVLWCRDRFLMLSAWMASRACLTITRLARANRLFGHSLDTCPAHGGHIVESAVLKLAARPFRCDSS